MKITKNILAEIAGTITGSFFGLAYLFGGPATFVYLTFFDGYQYNWWNWIIVIPINMLLSSIWPLYWLIIKPIMGY
jgi:hypothetical protein